MVETEIFLSRHLQSKELFETVCTSLGAQEGTISSIQELEAYLSAAASDVRYSVYVSNEKWGNEAVDEVAEVFAEAEKKNSFVNTVIHTEEILNIIDENGNITSESKPRSLVHRDGDLHPTVHVWIVKEMDMGVYVLLQKRSETKDAHPGCYDVSAAGHVKQSGDYRDTAVRELDEELGLYIAPEKLSFIGMIKNEYTDGNGFNDNELCAVYIYTEEVDADRLCLEKKEVSEVRWAEIDELLSAMGDAEFMHCIYADELQMIKKAVY